MRVEMSDLLRSCLFLMVCLCAGLAGCSEPAVGAPCLPEMVPENGFEESEAYVETSSVQCETRVCLVFRLRGDPREGCVASGCAEGDDNCQEVVCATPRDAEERIYCSCRCDAPNADFAECECPDGFSCEQVLREGGPGVQGGYCVKTSTL